MMSLPYLPCQDLSTSHEGTSAQSSASTNLSGLRSHLPRACDWPPRNMEADFRPLETCSCSWMLSLTP